MNKKGKVRVYAIMYNKKDIHKIVANELSKQTHGLADVLKEFNMAVIEPKETELATFVSTKQDDVADCAAELRDRFGITPVKIQTGFVGEKYYPQKKNKDWLWS